MPAIRYQGNNDYRVLSDASFIELVEAQDATEYEWAKGDVRQLPDAMWQAMKDRGLEGEFVEVSEDEVASTPDAPIDETPPEEASGSDQDDGDADDEG